MTPSALGAEHCTRAGDDADDAHQNMKAHHSDENRVSRGHGNTEYDGCLVRHAIACTPSAVAKPGSSKRRLTLPSRGRRLCVDLVDPCRT